MKKSITAAARVIVAAAAAFGFVSVMGVGTASAAPQDCQVSWDLFNAHAQCNDVDAPGSREYWLVVECNGLHFVPNAWPLVAIGPFQPFTGGSFGPTDSHSASCIDGLQIGTVSNAYVQVYRD